MPTMSLKVTRQPSGASDHGAPEMGKPLFRGSGGTDYLCGNCGSVIAASMGPTQRVNIDAATSSSVASMTFCQTQSSLVHDRGAQNCPKYIPTPRRPIV